MENNEKPKFTVKAVEGVEEKSTQELEQELLDKHEEKFEAAPKEEKQVEQVDTSSEKIEEPVAETQEPPKQDEGIKDTIALFKSINNYENRSNS